MSKPVKIQSFTCFYPGRSLVLSTQVTLSHKGRSVDIPATWDTGATRTCISTIVAARLSLPTIGTSVAITPSGTGEFANFIVDVELPNGIEVPELRVVGTQIHRQGIGALIGMDIISMGDFAVSCKDGKTQFTFRMPSMEDADYTIPSGGMRTYGERREEL